MLRISLCRCLLALCLIAGVAAPRIALSADGAATSVASNSAGTAKELSDAQARLRDTRDAMNRLHVQLNTPGLAATARSDLLRQFNLRQTLADRYAQQVEYLKQLQVLDQQISDATQQRDQWAPPTGSPPWPITVGDQARSEMLSAQKRIDQLSKELATIAEQIVTLGQDRAAAESDLRQLQEGVDNTQPTQRSDAERQQLADKQTVLALRSAVLLRADLERRTKERRRTLYQIQLDTASRNWNYYAGRFVLSPEVLAQAKGEMQTLIAAAREDELKGLNRLDSAIAELTQARSAYQALEQTKPSALRLAQAQAAVTIAQAHEMAARSEIDRVQQLIELGGYALQLWDARAEIYSKPGPSATRREEIADRVRLALVRVQQVREGMQRTLSQRGQEAFDLRSEKFLTHDSLALKVIAERLKAADEQSDAARNVLAGLDRFESLLTLVKSELGVQEREQTFRERLVSYGQQIAGWGQALWRYELFAIDDQVLVDGKEVKTTRSVTVGKSIGAVAILVFGFILVSRLIRVALGLAERRLGLKASVAGLIRRWLSIVASATLIVLSFNLVQIPLSVFAFLGGALAIGVGFGTQNLLKNLISGVMLLIERPIRLGDMVVIDDIRGRVTSIGIRFSTIHSSDGVDTLIPNSELVEKKLTNWTFSDSSVRREVKVGVAYGADPVQVKNLMQSAALEHPDVIHERQPVVLLDDLTIESLVFTLRYWIRLTSGVDGRQVDSDLRCEILEKLEAAGIKMPEED